MDTNVALHVETVGAGPPLVMLHGWALHGGLFAPIVHALSQAHRVHVVDLPGHGYSAPLRPWTIERVVDVLAERFAGGEPVCVLGWSLGGSIAMSWARRAASHVGRLLLVTATPKFVAGPDWRHGVEAQTLERFADELRVAFGPTLLRFVTLQTRGSEDSHALLAGLRRDLLARGAPDRAALDDALQALRDLDLRASVASIGQPALVVAGPRDTLVPSAACDWLARALPDGRLAVIDGAAHLPFVSHRNAFLDVARAFLHED